MQIKLLKDTEVPMAHWKTHHHNSIPVNSPNLLGDCRDEAMVENLFGSVTDFAQLVEEFGDEFTYQGVTVRYNEDTDIHTFYKLRY